MLLGWLPRSEHLPQLLVRIRAAAIDALKVPQSRVVRHGDRGV